MTSARLEPLFRTGRRLAIPVMTHPGIELLGLRVLDCVTDGATHAAAVVAVARRYPTAASTMVMDLTVEAEAFGAAVTFAEHEVPSIVGRRVEDLAGVQALALPGRLSGRLAQVVDATRRAAAAIEDRPVLAGCIGPFSLAARLFGMTEIMTSCLLEAETIALLLGRCTALLSDHARALRAAGADGLIMAEPAAGLLSAELCDAFSSPYVREVVEAVQDDDFLFVLHNCGNRGHCTASMVSTGARGLHLGNQADMVEALRVIPPDRLVMGNLDPAGLLKLSPATAVEAATAALLEATAPFPNFILSTGCDTPPGVPAMNFAALFRALDRFNARRL
jgi:uroporphyrinogen decarboxylase